MSSLYLDSSALLKRYLIEKGSVAMRTLFEKEQVIVTSSITYAEVHATLHRAARSNLLDAQAVSSIVEQFESEWRRFAVMEFEEPQRFLIPGLAKVTTLKGADLVHLASAVYAARSDRELRFIGADVRLMEAAAAQGLSVIDPTED